MGLGDLVGKALAVVGITEDRVNRWVGKCCCAERKARLNALGFWAARVLSGKTADAEAHLENLTRDS